MNTLRNIMAFAVLTIVFVRALGQAGSPGRYEVASPKWVMPKVVGGYSARDTALLPLQAPMLQWTMPVNNNSSVPVTFTYDLKIVEAMHLQDPLEAMERNPAAYQLRQLMAPQCLIPARVISKFSKEKVYVAQVTALAPFVQQQNGGRSDLLVFRVTDLKTKKPRYE